MTDLDQVVQDHGATRDIHSKRVKLVTQRPGCGLGTNIDIVGRGFFCDGWDGCLRTGVWSDGRGGLYQPLYRRTSYGVPRTQTELNVI